MDIDESTPKCRCCLTQSITVHPARIPCIPESLFTFGPVQLRSLSWLVGCPPRSLQKFQKRDLPTFAVSIFFLNFIDFCIFLHGMFCPALGAKVLTNCHLDHSPLASASFESARRATRKVLGPWRELKSAALALGLCRCCRFVSKRSRARNACCRAGSPTLGSLRIDGCHFVDEDNRIVLPRGINFSGLSKVPTSPDGATHLGGPQFYEHQDVSFVGRPCSLAELDTHLQRLKDWGFNLLRLVITWEAVEHQGPGMYDEDYLKFLRKVCQRAGDLGFWIIIDPHQDCWSRWTGGDGAPGWTLEVGTSGHRCVHRRWKEQR